MSDRRDRWKGHVSVELHLDSLIAVSSQKPRVSQGLGVRALAQNDNGGIVTSALGKASLNRAGGALAKATGCSDGPLQILKRMVFHMQVAARTVFISIISEERE